MAGHSDPCKPFPSSDGIPPKKHDVYGFLTTAWTAISQARRDGEERDSARERLIDMYWMPVFRMARSRLGNEDDAHDFTSKFFSERLFADSGPVAKVDSALGGFRGFLIRALRWEEHRHLQNKYSRLRHEQSLDLATCNDLEDTKAVTAECRFMRDIAVRMVQSSASMLRKEYGRAGARGRRLLQVFDDLVAEKPIAATAQTLGISLDAVKRDRKKLQDELWEMIADQTSFDGESSWDRESMQAVLDVLRTPLGECYGEATG